MLNVGIVIRDGYFGEDFSPWQPNEAHKREGTLFLSSIGGLHLHLPCDICPRYDVFLSLPFAYSPLFPSLLLFSGCFLFYCYISSCLD